MQWGVSHVATCHVALRKVEATSTFSATCNAIFRCETTGSCKHGVSHEEVFLATCNAILLQGKLPCCDMTVSPLIQKYDCLVIDWLTDYLMMLAACRWSWLTRRISEHWCSCIIFWRVHNFNQIVWFAIFIGIPIYSTDGSCWYQINQD